jgi:hypothetical protein
MINQRLRLCRRDKVICELIWNKLCLEGARGILADDTGELPEWSAG